MADREKVIKGLKCCGAIMHCNECPYDSEIGGCFTNLKADALNLLDEAPTIGGWISVKDRLPETRHAVLVYTPHYKNIWAASMHEDGNWCILSPHSGVYLDPDWHGPITHWMPLPEPPKSLNRRKK